MTDDELVATSRFDAAEHHPGFAKAMTATPPRARVAIAPVLPFVGFLIFWCILGGFVIDGFAQDKDAPVFFPVLVVGVGVVIVGSAIVSPFLKARSPARVERCLAVVTAALDGRVTLAYRDGKRRDVPVGPGVGPLARGDLGVGYLRDGVLAGFAPLA